MRRINSYCRFLSNLSGYLNSPLSPGKSRKLLRERLADRDTRFLELVREGIFADPRSPYLRLLANAGCTWEDMADGVRKDGLEATLQGLMQAGVWISPEEFKGRTPIKRGSFEFEVNPEDFENPCMAGGIGVSTGGTSGRSVKTRFDLDFLGARAAYDSIMFEMLGIEGIPLALFYPILPASTGVSNLLRYAKIGRIPDKWFEMAGIRKEGGRGSRWKNRALTRSIITLGKMAGLPLPFPRPSSLSVNSLVCRQILSWLEEPGACIFQSYVSQAVRLVEDLQNFRSDLSGLCLIVGSEPLTPTRKRLIESSGARIYPRYAATEVGTIAMGCGNPEAVDEMHLMSDMVALVQDEARRLEETSPLYFTSLDPVMPRILLNVHMGDMARVYRRRCGCAFDQLGFDTHLSEIRSGTRFTAAGMAVSASQLDRIVENVLAVRYGGTILDYQFAEFENKEGKTAIKLRIAPGIGSLDPERIINDVLVELQKMGEGERLMAEIWRQSATISVIRESPRPTVRCKIIPYLKENSVTGKEG